MASTSVAGALISLAIRLAGRVVESQFPVVSPDRREQILAGLACSLIPHPPPQANGGRDDPTNGGYLRSGKSEVEVVRVRTYGFPGV